MLRKRTDLFVDTLLAILALLSVLDDGVRRQQRIQVSEGIQRQPNHHEGHDLVNERSASSQSPSLIPMPKEVQDSPVRHDNSAILLGLLQGIIPRGRIIIVATPQHRELLLDVPLERQDDGDGRHEDVAHEGLDQVREDGRQDQAECYLQDVALEREVDKAVPHAAHLTLAALEEGVGLAGRGGA